MKRLFGFVLGISFWLVACTPRDAAVLPGTIARQGKVVVQAGAGAVVDQENETLSSCTSSNWSVMPIPTKFDQLLYDRKMKSFPYLGDRQCFTIGRTADVRETISQKAESTRGVLRIRRLEIKRRGELTQADVRRMGYETQEEVEAEILATQTDSRNSGLLVIVSFDTESMNAPVTTTPVTPPEEGNSDTDPETDTGTVTDGGGI